jgi:hypothetical protein
LVFGWVFDKTPPTFIKRQHPRKEEKKNQGARTKVQATKQPKGGGPQGGKGITNYQNLHQIA